MKKTIIRRVWWRLLRVVQLKKLSWNMQFKAGVWCRGRRNSETLAHVQKLCQGGKLVEFGCGEGTLPFSLPAGSYSSYAGYDISDVAIERAKRRAADAHTENVQFEQCDMAHWNGSNGISLILAEECLYYLSSGECERFLLRCSQSLTEMGSILVIVHSAARHKKTLAICRRVCQVRNEVQIEGRSYLTLRPS